MNNEKYIVVVFDDMTGKPKHSICGGNGVSKDKAEFIMAEASLHLDHSKYSLFLVPCVNEHFDEDE
jgi:hypothetical protein